MLITRTNALVPGMRKRTIGRQVHFGPVFLKFITVIILAAAAIFYLASTTLGATSNYKLQQSQEEKAKLEAENQRLQIEAVRLKSLNEIKNSTQNMNLEPFRK
ncbi:MAG: hypothetical protein COX39_03010 [Candidatus Nealsonbacteria bacterium CG23_combo_of_CG06-09_8_20_14_all_40_13]|uniref:Cell division protein FtsL n=1 Tax=Candidatus Nealsonbacteria bacterium CG23_combo_of_CG06-09_8_20_14_all_40_13 TaxID=1974724 RepID=A0A2G9YQA7_9BACT|nr:MAG: hypothetical protein COX39_03010 [Candidatus Nealsonbacteria bacterium CG23_combo_of_CG06-09_8_20_14_all_40_13]PIR71350.1 MAG: hypothetical protein COU44_00055 [Candidatus Nealsonbacteria bacterium CG10_big_fil_rev_8_21_14_0_10_40_24]PIU43208.1 MAG: hypothetical protein COS97_02300 [Candidatus Nealsonbacteria bacterium CG07_land_8_20_14_0_80_40_10]